LERRFLDSQIRGDSCRYSSKYRGGALKPGDKLPTVVEFCELYSVSKITVKRAIEQITEEGLITSRRGSGTYVKDTAGLPGQAFFQGKNDRAQGFRMSTAGRR